MTKLIRHGDIPLHPYAGEVKGKEIKHNGSFVVAEGETTGHMHVVKVAEPQFMRVVQNDRGTFLIFEKEATISHQEHKTITIQPGTYRVGKERTKDWFTLTTRKVQD